MLLAIIATLLNNQILDFQTIFIGIVIGSAIGAVLAKRVEMTSMPQLVALFNGFGGGASLLVSLWPRCPSDASARTDSA